MSGDKLLGGPQGGIIVGATVIMERLRANPLLRALRVDKLTIAALEATLALYREPKRAMREIPVLAMLSRSIDDLRRRADALKKKLGDAGDAGDAARVVESEASVGGGAFPSARIPSVALAFAHDARGLEERLRLGEPAVIGRISDDRLLLDMRTVQPDEDDMLAAAVRAALTS
jgi:L-seryl-tRNA(Ser) seleniumtransferase